MASRRRARGSVLPLGLALMAAGALALLWAWSSGERLSAHGRLATAADAAALSTAAWHARVLNYQAYANRAIVAHDVALAQAVTRVAWARYLDRTAGNIETVSRIYPPLHAVVQPLASAAELARGMTEATASAEALQRAIERAQLRESQRLLLAATGGNALNTVSAEVARANDRRFFAFVMPEVATGRIVAWRGDDAGLRRFAAVDTASLDPFAGGRRDWDSGGGNCLPGARKRGGTALAPDLSGWVAVDTVSLHAGCRASEWLPIGWGAAVTAGTPARPSGNAAARGNVRATALGFRDVRTLPASGRIEAYPDVDPSLADDRRPRVRLPVLAMVDAARMPGAASRGHGAGRLALDEPAPGGRLWALAVGQVEFRRPADAPARVEYASLFNPYWQARLAEPSAAERAAAAARAR